MYVAYVSKCYNLRKSAVFKLGIIERCRIVSAELFLTAQFDSKLTKMLTGTIFYWHLLPILMQFIVGNFLSVRWQSCSAKL